uniref:CLIP domain-containing serine protease n=1 Tax=Glossina brevipalpis TaxID=37001 RepID=A0A1A9WB41_9MUSC
MSVKMKAIIVFLLIIVANVRCQRFVNANTRNTKSNDNVRRCLNPNQRIGTCVAIQNCQVLMHSDYDFIRASRCGGGFGETPIVCCSSDTGFTQNSINDIRRNNEVFDYSNEVYPNEQFESSVGSVRDQFWTENANIENAMNLLPKPPTCGGEFIDNRIYGGRNSEVYEFPWLAFLEYSETDPNAEIVCSGSLINPRYVLTAAHCVKGAVVRLKGELVAVRLGVHDYTENIRFARNMERIRIIERIVHELYKTGKNPLNDIALLRLEDNVKYSKTIRPICMPWALSDYTPNRNVNLTVIGWGATEKKSSSAVKQKVTLALFDQTYCQQQYATLGLNIEWTQICAGGELNKDSCRGDSGAPLMHNHNGIWVLQGIVSFGRRCGNEGWPGVYSRISSYVIHKYLYLETVYFNEIQNESFIKCKIPNQSELIGDCVAVSQCSAYLEVRNSLELTAEKVNFLKNLQCPKLIHNLESTVCCPLNGQRYRDPLLRFTKLIHNNVNDKGKKRTLKHHLYTSDQYYTCGKQVTQRIYGGEIAELNEFPWLALLLYNTNEFSCSGVLIDNRHILTAAHCVNGEGYRLKKGIKYVRLGEFNVRTEPDCIEEINYLNCADSVLNIEIDHIFIHPEYKENSRNKFHDIAVIRLEDEVTFSNFIMPICLPNKTTKVFDFEEGHIFSVSGWGRTDLFNKYFTNIHSPIKLKLRIPFVSKENCSKIMHRYGIQLGSEQFCAGGEFGKDTCAGDSGGPLMYFDRKHSRWITYGIVSYGFTRCGLAGHPAVYTNVAAYLDWIHSVITEGDNVSLLKEK